jgi:hypothetical protein
VVYISAIVHNDTERRQRWNNWGKQLLTATGKVVFDVQGAYILQMLHSVFFGQDTLIT